MPIWGSYYDCYCFPNFFDMWVWVWINAPDTIDRIIAEYDGLERAAPSRSEFVTEHSSDHFSKGELNDGHYDHFVPGKMTEMAEAVREAYNNAIDGDTDYGIRITSGYRNPRRNDEVSRTKESKHQWGEAVDLAPLWNASGRAPGKSYKDAMTDIYEAADAALGADYDVVNEGNHIHVEYDP